MIKAISTIVVKGKVFQPGQPVFGLSSADKIWMKKAGYITEIMDKKKNSGIKRMDTGQKGSDENEF